MRILIVEDVKKEADILKAIVSKYTAAQGISCSSAEKALTLIEKQHFDLFILDVELPGKDGFFLAQQIRSKEGYGLTPILFVTGSDRSALEAFKAYHCHDFIEKPYRHQELYEKLLKLMSWISEEKRISEGVEGESKGKELACISTTGGEFYIKKKELLFVEIRRGVGILHLADKVIEKNSVNLVGILEDINDEYVVRCHKSFALNLRNVQYIRQVDYRKSIAFFSGSDASVEISRKYYEEVLGDLEKLNAPKSGKNEGEAT